MVFDRTVPYNALPKLPPVQEIDTKNILKLAISANRALAELKTRGSLLPNQNLLIDSLVFLEAKDSSEIENIFTTHDKLYQSDAIEEVADHYTKEVQRYREALWGGIASIKTRPLSTNTFIEVVQTIKENQSGIRTTQGTKISSTTGEIIYTPPEGQRLLADLLQNLEHYLHEADDVDPLIKMAVLHYQFEAIHPFADGNGRAGRIMNILYLLQEKRLEVPVLFLSNYFLRNKIPYYKGLQNVTEHGQWEEWILYILKAIETTSYETMARIDAIRQAMEKFQATMLKEVPKIYTKDLLEVLFEQPYCRIQSLVNRGIAKRVTASTYLQKLQDAGLLEAKKFSHYVVYLNPVLMDVLRKPAEELTKLA